MNSPLVATRLAVLALALLSAPAVLDGLAQPALDVAPALGRRMEGGTILFHIIAEVPPGEAALCVDVRVEPWKLNEEAELNQVTRRTVCANEGGAAVLMAKSATGRFVVDWDGNVTSRPYLVPERAIAETYASISGGQMHAPTGTLRGTNRNESQWAPFLDAAAYVGCLVALLLGARLWVAAAMLAVATLLIVPLAVDVQPHVPGGVLLLTWLLVLALLVRALLQRRRRSSAAVPSGPDGSPTPPLGPA